NPHIGLTKSKLARRVTLARYTHTPPVKKKGTILLPTVPARSRGRAAPPTGTPPTAYAKNLQNHRENPARATVISAAPRGSPPPTDRHGDTQKNLQNHRENTARHLLATFPTTSPSSSSARARLSLSKEWTAC
uniref:Uncharacterized protein n=1 Tax=Oryza nivara TaxID=4536 RepID=A0A0E0HEQ2_ORYNI